MRPISRNTVQIADAQRSRSPERTKNLLHAAEEIRVSLLRAARDIRRFAAVPRDADQKCRCAETRACCLPIPLEEQMLEVDLPEE